MAEETGDTCAITLHEANFTPEMVEGHFICVGATDRPEVNRAVFEAADSAGRLVNVVDQPHLCNYITPAIVDRSPIVVAISSEGRAPVLARTLRATLETLIPANLGLLGRLMGELRDRARERFPEVGLRRRFWEEVVDGPIASLAYSGREDDARAALAQALAEAEPPRTGGEVYLIGGGPGDPDLLTFRALRLMQKADVVVYDRLVAPAILELARRDAERIYVGKSRDVHTVPQDRINELLIEQARMGRRVVRLKGGDPFMFGRGGEEIDTLAREGIPFQVVPGITSANGCACYAGIPLTHRDYAHACVFVTGHLKDGVLDVDFKTLVQPRHTLCVYMGVHSAEALSRGLIGAGMRAEMPVAIVERGTTAEQRVVETTLESLPEAIVEHAIVAPAMLIVGEVVRLRDRLRWDAAPLPAATSVVNTDDTGH
jgi:uroporphyrin-III C-methyltransferase/precorrin-2 dehydrogenase/sirohydrochlorin ferrochelatase